jgi:hypothetical protein
MCCYQSLGLHSGGNLLCHKHEKHSLHTLAYKGQSNCLAYYRQDTEDVAELVSHNQAHQ